MPAKNSKGKRSKGASKKASSKTEDPVESVSAPVEDTVTTEDHEDSTTVENTVESTTENATEISTDEVEQVQTELGTTQNIEQILEMCKMLTQVVQKLQKKAKDLHKRVQSRERRLNKLEERKANKKKSNAGNQLKKFQPVFTTEFTSFIEQNHQTLNNKQGEQILTELSYDDDGRLLISRENCLRLVNSYVRQSELQQYEDKKRIKMDDTLRGLFPELAEVKKGSKVIQEENCYFHTLMGGISRHLKDPSQSDA